DVISENQLDRKAAMVQIPALIKAYLRLGGAVGEGAFLDHSFNTTDVCLVLDVAEMPEKQRRMYLEGAAG
ncbi:MAG: ornithine-acyl-ACP acyltransferase, partial [Planktotalea sp.]